MDARVLERRQRVVGVLVIAAGTAAAVAFGAGAARHVETRRDLVWAGLAVGAAIALIALLARLARAVDTAAAIGIGTALGPFLWRSLRDELRGPVLAFLSAYCVGTVVVLALTLAAQWLPPQYESDGLTESDVARIQRAQRSASGLLRARRRDRRRRA